MTFRFPTPRKRGKPDLDTVNRRFYKHTEEEQMGLIQGKEPDSIEEWNIAKALWRLGIRFLYQHPVLGGRTRRGGYIIDFLLLMPWGEVPLEYFGQYWHGGKLDTEDRNKINILQSIYGVEPIVLKGDQAEDEEIAYRLLRNMLGATA